MDVDPNSLPMGANPATDRLVGRDELGRPVRQSQFGVQYVVEATPRDNRSVIKGAYNALLQDPLGATGNALMGLAQGAWQGISAPGNALAGQPVTNGDALGAALSMFGGGAPMAAPEGALRSGAMRTAGQAKAEEILTLLRNGEGAKVTDEMMAAADPQHLYRNYDLPMDAASRMARAKEMGFDTATPLYHGTGADFQAFDKNPSHRFSANSGGPQAKAAWLTESPPEASRYAGSELTAETGAGSPNVMPTYYKPSGETIVDNRYDVPAAPKNTINVRQDLYSALSGESQHWRVVPDASTIRSAFARFDPRLSHLKNLSAGFAALGMTYIASALDPEAQR